MESLRNIRKKLETRGHSNPKKGAKALTNNTGQMEEPNVEQQIRGMDLHYAIWSHFHYSIEECRDRDLQSVDYNTIRTTGPDQVKFEVSMLVDDYCITGEPKSLKKATITLGLEHSTIEDVVIH